MAAGKRKSALEPLQVITVAHHNRHIMLGFVRGYVLRGVLLLNRLIGFEARHKADIHAEVRSDHIQPVLGSSLHICALVRCPAEKHRVAFCPREYIFPKSHAGLILFVRKNTGRFDSDTVITRAGDRRALVQYKGVVQPVLIFIENACLRRGKIAAHLHCQVALDAESVRDGAAFQAFFHHQPAFNAANSRRHIDSRIVSAFIEDIAVIGDCTPALF